MTVVSIHGVWSGLFTVIGVFAAFNLYVIGIISHESINMRSIPSFWLLLRAFQLVIFLLTDDIMWQYLAVHVGWDIVTFILFYIDGRYSFIEKEDINTKAKTMIRRGEV